MAWADRIVPVGFFSNLQNLSEARLKGEERKEFAFWRAYVIRASTQDLMRNPAIWYNLLLVKRYPFDLEEKDRLRFLCRGRTPVTGRVRTRRFGSSRAGLIKLRRRNEDRGSTDKERSEGTRSFRYRRGAKVLVVENIGEERSHSTEVRKERSEATRLRLGRRGARLSERKKE